MTDLESSNPLYKLSVILCAAVKKYKCLHDQNSYHKSARPECEEAWKLVAEECNETVDFCKSRWKTLRRCFFEGIKRRGNKYYLHDHLKFLQGASKKKNKRKHMPTFNDETNFTAGDAMKKSQLDNLSLQIYDNEDGKSVDSRTTSADESHEIIEETDQNGVFIIDEIEEEAFGADTNFLDETRLAYKRSCKRPLDPEIIDELTEEEPEDKRSRKRDKHNILPQLTNKPIKMVRMDKIKINLIENRVESVKGKMVDRFTYTDFKPTRDFGTQYEMNSLDFDDIFMQSIKAQLIDMNGRQKLNFKRKIFQSLLEVFDDAADFPHINETIPLAPKLAPCVVDTTIGELRLMRELAALVQAAKSTPEIMNAKDKTKTCIPVQSKSPLKMPLPIVDNHSKTQTSPISLSPCADDDDLQFFIDNLDDEVNVPLTRSGEEKNTKPVELTKVSNENNVAGLPRRVLQKVVRVSGPTGSTIVTRDGDKKRIYRIFPKLVNSNSNYTPVTKNGNSSGSFFVSTSKSPQNTKKESAVGTFYVTGTKNTQDTTKVSNGVSNINTRPLNNKPTNQTLNMMNVSSQPTNANSTNSAINNQTIFKNVHPANRVLSPTTGFFKMVPTTKTITPSNVPSSGAQPTNSNFSKVITGKFPASSMLPPNSNLATKRTQAVRVGPQIMQRRYSICGPLSGENSNTSSPDSTATIPKHVIAINNGNPQAKSSVSHIQISQPISLNAIATNAQTASSNRKFSSSINSKTTAISAAASKDVKVAVQSPKTSQETVSISTGSTATSKKCEQIPILQTAGTVEADDLDPLFVKTSQIKTEPTDE